MVPPLVPAAHLPLSRSRRSVITVGLMTGMALAALEATVVGTAMPTIIAQLGGLQIYSWVFSAYLLTSTVTVPIWGKLSDIYGRRVLYLIGISIFLVGSILSGQANSMLALILSRALQGLGAGALVPIALTIIGDIYSLQERARMQGFFSGTWGLASIAGPVVGGYVTDHLSWRWVFYLNVPIGLAALAILSTALVEPKRTEKRVSIDYAGAITLTTSITLMLFLLVQGWRKFGWLSAPVIGGSLLCLVLLGLFVYFERRAPDPLLPLALFKSQLFSASALINILAGMAFFGAISFMPLFIQGVMGTTASQAGRVLTVLTLGWVLCSVISSRLILHWGYRPVVLLGGALLVIGFGLLSSLGLEATTGAVLRDSAFIGCGMGFSMIALLLAVQNSVPRQQLGVATSSVLFFRTIGGAIGVAIMGSVLTAQMNRELARSAPGQGLAPKVAALFQNPDVMIDPAARAALPLELLETMRGALSHSLHYVFVIGLIVSLLALLAGLLVPKGKPHEHVP